jgi:hypothetical protein
MGFYQDQVVPRIRQPFAGFGAQDAAGLRLNGSLALGVLARCRALLARLTPDPPVTRLTPDPPVRRSRAAARRPPPA